MVRTPVVSVRSSTGVPDSSLSTTCTLYNVGFANDHGVGWESWVSISRSTFSPAGMDMADDSVKPTLSLFWKPRRIVYLHSSVEWFVASVFESDVMSSSRTFLVQFKRVDQCLFDGRLSCQVQRCPPGKPTDVAVGTHVVHGVGYDAVVDFYRNEIGRVRLSSFVTSIRTG